MFESLKSDFSALDREVAASAASHDAMLALCSHVIFYVDSYNFPAADESMGLFAMWNRLSKTDEYITLDNFLIRGKHLSQRMWDWSNSRNNPQRVGTPEEMRRYVVEAIDARCQMQEEAISLLWKTEDSNPHSYNVTTCQSFLRQLGAPRRPGLTGPHPKPHL